MEFNKMHLFGLAFLLYFLKHKASFANSHENKTKVLMYYHLLFEIFTPKKSCTFVKLLFQNFEILLHITLPWQIALFCWTYSRKILEKPYAFLMFSGGRGKGALGTNRLINKSVFSLFKCFFNQTNHYFLGLKYLH